MTKIRNPRKTPAQEAHDTTCLDEITATALSLRLANTDDRDDGDGVYWTRAELIAEAQVHATLAVARAIREMS